METLIQNKWLILSTIEFLIILFLFYRLKRNNDKSFIAREIKKSKGKQIDMNELMKDINLSKDLYKQLSRACHPDRFAGTELEITANELFQEVQQSENNYAALCDLKKQIEEKLNLSIS
jgi:hypothetical protein